MQHIHRNIFKIIGMILLSVVFAFLIFPTLMQIEPLQNFLSGTKKEPLIGATALVWLFFISTWKSAKHLWLRYRSNYRLSEPPFVHVDYAVVFVLFIGLLIWLFQAEHIPILSSEFKVFAFVNVVSFVALIILAYCCKQEKQQQSPLSNEKYSLSDDPIQFPEQDLLGRGKFVEDLYKAINDLPFTDSFVFGLYGEWGEGKSSVINLLNNKLQWNEDCLVVSFNPWYFKDEEAILAAFFQEIEQALAREFILPGLKKRIKKYRGLISTGLSQAGIRIDLSHIEESVEEIRQRIESDIKHTGKKIIIIIDDIDRLQPKEALLVLKLVRLNVRLENTIFLLGLDPTIVRCYLDGLKGGPEFFEKIVQKPIALPAIDQTVIEEFLFYHIDRHFGKLVITEEEKKRFGGNFLYIYQTQIRKLFKTLRHAKRYMNGILSTLPAIETEVDLHDFLILEVIKVFYPEVYKDIWTNPWSYIPVHWGDAMLFCSPFILPRVGEDKYSQIKKHIEDIVRDEKEKEVLTELLKTIFFVEVENALGANRVGHDGSAATYRVQRRITHPEVFAKCFLLRVPAQEMSDEFVETTINQWCSTEKSERERVIEKQFLALQKESKLLNFFNMIRIFIDKIDTETALDIVTVISKNAGRFSDKRTGSFGTSEYDSSEMLLLHLINDKVKSEEIQDILEKTTIETPHLPFAVDIVYFCNKEGGGSFRNIYDSIEIGELQSKLSSRLKTHFIDQSRDIFKELPIERNWNLVIGHWATNWGTFAADNRKVVNEYVFSLLAESPKRFVKFLKVQISRPFASDIPRFNLDELARAYDLEWISELAHKFGDDASLAAEEKEAIEMFLRQCQDRSGQRSPTSSGG